MGGIDVPADRYRVAQSQCSLVHFWIGDDRMPERVYHAYPRKMVGQGLAGAEPWRCVSISGKSAMMNDAWCGSAGPPTPRIARSLAATLLPSILSLTAGSADVISFLGLGGLFTAHITGNLVILAAHIVAGREAPLALMISVPVFIAALAMTRLLAAGLERINVGPLRPLLLLQFLLLAGFLGLCVGGRSRLDPDAARATVAGMLGVAAMAVQNALVQISLKGTPSTAVLTTNITRFVMDLGEALFAGNPSDRAKAGERARRTGLAIAGFTVGCGLGAGCQAIVGLWSLMLPTYLSLMAVAMALAADFDRAHSPAPFPRVAAERSPLPGDTQSASPSGTASHAGRS